MMEGKKERVEIKDNFLSNVLEEKRKGIVKAKKPSGPEMCMLRMEERKN